MNENNSFLTLFLAPVAAYLEDDSVSEILINGPKQVRSGPEYLQPRFVRPWIHDADCTGTYGSLRRG